MDEIEIIKRQIYLKKQGLFLTAQEIFELEQKLARLLLKQEFESVVGTDFDELISCRKIGG